MVEVEITNTGTEDLSVPNSPSSNPPQAYSSVPVDIMSVGGPRSPSAHHGRWSGRDTMGE